MNRITNLIRELQERRVFRIASVYAVTMWIVIQGAIDLFPVFGIPDWATRLLVIIAVVGFPIAIILGWAYQVTAEGVVRDEASHPAGGRHRKVDYIVVGALVLLVAFILLREQFTRVVDMGEGAAATGEVAAAASTEAAGPGRDLHPQSIAVLPFVNMSSDEDTEYFSDGITEELLNVLANIPGLRVASRTSAFAFKDSQADVPTISQRLGVAFVLEGSVRRSMNTVRITAQLIDARDDIHVWSETYDRELLEIFAIQDEISAAIVDRLKPAVLAARGSGSAGVSSTTDNLDAYDLYLRGRSAFSAADPGALERSIAHLEDSLDLDADFARTHSALARSLLAYSKVVEDGGAHRQRAFEEARIAIRLDGRLREAHEILRQQ